MLTDRPPTPTEYRQVAHYLFDTLADALGPARGGERVVIGPTRSVGTRRYGFVRIVGSDPYRFKLAVSEAPSGAYNVEVN